MLITIVLSGLVAATPAGVHFTGDTAGDQAAFSGTGNATAADGCGYVPLPVSVYDCAVGAAVTGTGDAGACRAENVCAGVAATGTGAATACDGPGVGLYGCTGLAASGTGPATGSAAVSGLGDATGSYAAASLGDAAACNDRGTVAYGAGCSGVAVAGDDATACEGRLVYGTECTGVAVSPTGHASACDSQDHHWGSTGRCLGVAVSGTGDASACDRPQTSRCTGVAVSGCDTPLVCRGTASTTAPTGVAIGPDADGDGAPAFVALTTTRVAFDRAGPDVTAAPSDPVTFRVDPDDDTPTTVRVPTLDVPVVRGVTVGPDNDGDGVPHHVDVTLERFAVNVHDGTVTSLGVDTVRLRLDGADNDPDAPVAATVTVTGPPAVVVGPDADGDGVPATVTMAATRVTFDRTTSTLTTTRDADADRVVPLDFNDANPDFPVRRSVTVTAPAAVAFGPDNDGDGVPATATLTNERVTFDRTDGRFIVTRDADTTVTLDAADDDPETPARSTVTAVAVTGVRAGPDADGDGVPAFVAREETVVTFDRRDGSLTTAPREGSRVTLDAADDDPGSPVATTVSVTTFLARIGPDDDGDGVPRHVVIEQHRVAFDRTTREATVTHLAARDSVVTLDQRDHDPNVPAASVASVTVPTSVIVGPDDDADGRPAFVKLTAERVTIDRRTGAVTVTRDASGDRVVATDDDTDPRVTPLASVAVDDDATADNVAASLNGNAASCGTSLTCAAASGTGDAESYHAVSVLGDATGCDLDYLCSATSVTGEATSGDVAFSGTGTATGRYSASVLGDAHGDVAVSALGSCNGEACAAAGGHAEWVSIGPGSSRALVAIGDDADGGLIAVGVRDARGGLVGVGVTGRSDSGLLDGP